AWVRRPAPGSNPCSTSGVWPWITTSNTRNCSVGRADGFDAGQKVPLAKLATLRRWRGIPTLNRGGAQNPMDKTPKTRRHEHKCNLRKAEAGIPGDRRHRVRQRLGAFPDDHHAERRLPAAFPGSV